ncbi:methenyltetrahydrofolate synthetase isoform X2 [Lycorma delicatula]|uniref:methenyltetrahydrofolate synthetase isoform X2 n=1 Tax=Lycorma delicatula TaxID=130591 RepID=UPI003F511D30
MYKITLKGSTVIAKNFGFQISTVISILTTFGVTSLQNSPIMNTSVRAMKAKIREEMKKTISSLSSTEQERQSNVIVEKLLSHTLYKDSKRISIYLSMKNEVQTDKIVEDILSSGKDCFVPSYNKTEMSMLKLYSMQDLKSLPLTKWNIRQPEITDERENAIDKGLDLMIVPGLAFTENGLRLGRGKGYYDRYIEEYNKKTGQKFKTLGLAFQQQILNDLPTDKNDAKLDLVIYPRFNINVVAPETSKEYDMYEIK